MALRSLRGGLKTFSQSTFSQQTWGLTDAAVIPDPVFPAFQPGASPNLYRLSYDQRKRLRAVYETGIIAMVVAIVEVISG